MSSPQTQKTSDLQAVADALRSHDRFLLVTHENPDGDALGSLLATKLALDSLGKDSEMYLHGDAPLPREYGFMPLEGLRREPPDDAEERVLVALDCANEQRIGPDTGLVDKSPLTLDIDHHHDNSRFGDLNLVVGDASSTGEVLRDLFAELGVELTPEIAEALYIAVVTDTGRFQYTNTTPKALRLAAELVEAGADVHRVFQGVYESVEFAKLKLLARALERASGYFKKILAVDASHFESLVYSGIAASEGGDAEHAEALLKRAIEKKPEGFLPHFALGALYANHSRWSDAERALLRALDVAPVLSAQILLGTVLREKGELNRAIQSFEEAQRLQPDSEEAVFQLGLCYLEKNWTKRALDCFQQALEKNPKKLEYQEAVRLLERRRRYSLPRVVFAQRRARPLSMLPAALVAYHSRSCSPTHPSSR
jgi:nanoRNase/pAp phosphatase (c-di-AMP/oligoRNAs hydrolase)